VPGRTDARAPVRRCAGLARDVVEIGYGSGLDQPHLPPEVTGLRTVEPSATAIRLAQKRRSASAIPVVVARPAGYMYEGRATAWARSRCLTRPGGAPAGRLVRIGRSPEIPGMTSFASPTGWLPAALSRVPAPRRPAPPVRAHGRHAAPESPATAPAIATASDLLRSGRHAEPAWTRAQFDPARDEVDPLDWLGFHARQG
jgi:hypothetical protein